MPLELLEYQVFQKGGVASTGGANATGTAVITLPNPVPLGETWRVDRIAALVLVPGGSNAFINSNPILFVYDNLNPQPTSLPVDVTELLSYSPPGLSNPVPPIATGGALYFLDADDLAAPITLLAGFQLTLLFYAAWATSVWAASARIQYTRFKGSGGAAQPVAV